MNEFLIVDGNSIANRAYYALPFLSNSKGEPSGAVFGFANILIKIIQEVKPKYLLVAFDHARKTFRNEIYSEYKMQRKPSPEELIAQFPAIKEMLKKMNIKTIEEAGIEADDIIGTASKLYDGKKIILTGDRDLLQLIDDNTTVWLTKKGVSEVDKVDEQRLHEIFALKPYQIIELKALMGDASDNIPGVKGVGEKTAQSLLEKYKNIENLYAHIDEEKGKLQEKLIVDKEMAFISKQLATINRECDIRFDIEQCILTFPFPAQAYNFFKEWNFTSLIKNEKLFSSSLNEEGKTEESLVEENSPKKQSRKIEKKPLDKKSLEKILKETKGEFCYSLNSLEFLCDDKIYFISQNYDMFGDTLSLEKVLKELKPIFENEKIVKITTSSKHDMAILSQYAIELNNYFDLTIAFYIVSGGLKTSTQELEVKDYVEAKNSDLKQLEKLCLTHIFNDIETPLAKILFEMERDGFKIDGEKLEIISNEFEQKIEKLKKEIYFEAGSEFNINSPKQVAIVLFDTLGIQAYNNKKRSTNANVLDQLRHIPIVENILTYRKYTKLKNTYIDVYRELVKKDNGIIHTTFNQTLTSTGRLSSSEPNLQNIPTRDDEGKLLRKIFVSKFEGGKIISADYNQIELRLLADMSGEEKLIQSYKEGKDIHSATASDIFGIPLEKVTASERRDAKAVNFGIIYGISDYGLSQNIKSTRIKAKGYIDSYFDRYPLLKKFMDENVAFAKEKGYALTKLGRIRYIPEISSSKYLTRSFGERVAMNMPLQGTASDIIKVAMIKVANRIKKENLKSQLILQIHDELIVDTFPNEEKQVEKVLIEEMENVLSLKVPLVVGVGCGESLYECK